MPRKGWENDPKHKKKKNPADRTVNGRSFETDWEAALYILLDSGVTIKSFIEHVLNTKTQVSKRHHTIPEKSYWKYLIFRDTTVDEVAHIFKLTDGKKGNAVTKDGSPETSSSQVSESNMEESSSDAENSDGEQKSSSTTEEDDDDDDDDEVLDDGDNSDINVTEGVTTRHNASAESHRQKRLRKGKAARSGRQAAIPQRKRRKISDTAGGADESSSSQSGARRVTDVGPAPLDSDYSPSEADRKDSQELSRSRKGGRKGQPRSSERNASEPPSIGRTAPEYEGKTICSSCGKRGVRMAPGRPPRSGGDSNVTRKAFYYCRNTACPRGTGTRYIGWTLENMAGEPVKDEPDDSLTAAPGPAEVRQVEITTTFSNKSAYEILKQMEKLKPNDQGRAVCRYCNKHGVEIIKEDVSIFVCNQEDCSSIKLVPQQPLARVIGWAIKKVSRRPSLSKDGGAKETSNDPATSHDSNVT